MENKFKYIDLSDITEKELVEVLKDNRRTCILTKQEIKRLKTSQQKEKEVGTSKKENIPVSKKENKREEELDMDFEEEIDYYLTEFKSLDISEFDTRLEEVLPVRKNYNYEKIIYRLMAEIVKEMKDINDIILEERLSLEESRELKEEVEILKKKLEYLKNALVPKSIEEIEQEQEVKNRMIFAPTKSGNLRIFDDLKAIPEEYYESFLELFKSIEDGTFKNIRKFVNHDSIKGIYEVKNFKTRIMFTRLSKDCYAIVTAFMKKTTNDNGYRRLIELKINDYKDVENKIKNKLEDEEFITMQEQALEEVYELLGDEKNNEKGKTYE